MLKKSFAIMLACALAVAAGAEITANLVVYDVGPLIETGEEFVAYRLVVALSETDDWTSAQISATLTEAVFYQDENSDGNPPDPAAFGDYPDSEFTSYYTSPEDYPNISYAGDVVGFNAGPTETTTTLDADWFDVVTSSDGAYVVAQLTVLPGSSAWTGQVDVTVYSAGNPAGYVDSYAISAADYEPVVTATYIGPDGGTYDDPNNWDIGAVPLNVGLSRYNVIIPESASVNFNIVGESYVSGLSLGYDSTFGFLDGERLLVRGTSVISGIVNASGVDAAFMAPSRFSAFSGSGPRILAANTAHVHIAAPSYYWDPPGNWTSTTLLSADGADTLLDLSSLGSVSVPQNYHTGNVYSYSVIATNGGMMDLSSVSTVTGATSNDWLRFQVANGGDIDFASLSLVTGRTWFDINVPDYTLPALENVSTTHMDATDAQNLSLPVLGAFDDGTFTAPDGATIDAPLLVSFTYSTMSIADGGTVNAPQLTDVTGSYFNLNPTRVLVVPPFEVINHARMLLGDGATLTVDAASYLWDPSGNWGSTELLSADGAGTLLDLSSLTSMSVPQNYHTGNVYAYSVNATNDGAVDLSSVETATGAGSNDWLKFHAASGGSLDLQSLGYINGNVWFDIDVPDYELPALIESVTKAHFDLAEGAELRLPVLQRIVGSGSSLTIPVFAKFDAPVLEEMNGATVYLSVGATLDAPNLTTFTTSYLQLTQIEQGGLFLDVPPFTNIDNSRLILEDGSTFTTAAPSYYWDPSGNWGSTTLISADGAGTVLDMSSVFSINVPQTYHSTNVYYYSIVAGNNGVIDLSNVATISGAGGNDWHRLTTNSGGQILLGDVLVSGGRTMFEIDGTASGLEFTGGLTLLSPAQLHATLAATLALAGDFTFNHTSESSINAGGGTFHMNGAGTQLLEVGGEDIGVPDGAVSNNFEIGQLKVGRMDQATIVKLVDDFDNGNRGATDVEALYLQGFPGSDNGLRILGGSTLVIENIQVYAQESDEWVHINNLFPAGVNQIPYDDGFIALSIVVNDCNGNGIDDHVDILLDNSDDCNENDVPDECEIDVNSEAPGGPFYCTENCDPDCNVNGVPDVCDIAACDPNDPDCQDCNENDVPDACDIAAETSQDTNFNGIPDECEDCNNNGVPDYQDMADCDGSPWCDDCNANGILDWCDIDAGTSEDVNVNGIPDSCEEDCQPNGVPDGWDIETQTSQDCQPNGVPDECDIDSGASEDVNGNGIPDECEPDCQPNGVPDDWDISTGISQDCNGNEIPDECDIAGGASTDVNDNGVPDECETDCQPNDIPDSWDIATGTSQDCNENDVPDECDIAGGTSLDTDSNGVPDECQDCNNNGVLDWMDILNGTSEDCNDNGIPDECEEEFEIFTWIGPDGGFFNDPANWDLGAVPGGEADLFNTGDSHNTCILNLLGETKVCNLTLRSNNYWQTLQINDGCSLLSAGGGAVDNLSRLELAGGELGGGFVTNTGTIRGYGEINAAVENFGTLHTDAGGDLSVTGAEFINRYGGLLRASFGTLLNIQTDTFMQQGVIEVQSAAALLVDWAIVNEAGGRIELIGGALGAEDLDNSNEAEVVGFGTIQVAAAVNNLGAMTFGADTQIIGQQIVNYGTITIQSGTLSFFGPLMNNGVIIGDYVGGAPLRLAGEGIFVRDDFSAGAGASLMMPAPDTALRVGGDYDVAIDDNTRYRMNAAELRLTGTGTLQALEVMSQDIGPNPAGLNNAVAGRYPVGKLRIGPSTASVRLFDNHDNDGLGQGEPEAIYVETLHIDQDAALYNAAAKIYYYYIFNEGVVEHPENLIRIGVYGDLDGDGQVGINDLAIVLAHYNQSGLGYLDGDLDGDDDVDLDDLAILLGLYGTGA